MRPRSPGAWARCWRIIPARNHGFSVARRLSRTAIRRTPSSPPSGRPVSSCRRRSIRANDALTEQRVTVKPRLAGGDDGKGVACTLVEGEAFNSGERHWTAHRLAYDVGEFPADLGNRAGIANHRHARRRAVDEIVERQDREHGFKNARRNDTVEPDETPSIRGSRKIGVHECQLVAMSHAAQDGEKIGAEHRVETFQHGTLTGNR